MLCLLSRCLDIGRHLWLTRGSPIGAGRHGRVACGKHGCYVKRPQPHPTVEQLFTDAAVLGNVCKRIRRDFKAGGASAAAWLQSNWAPSSQYAQQLHMSYIKHVHTVQRWKMREFLMDAAGNQAAGWCKQD